MTRRLLTLVVGSALVLGCGGSPKPSTPSTPQMTIVVQSDEETNQGRPLHMLVRAVDLQTFLEEPYPSVAEKVITPDDSVLTQTVIFPGTEEEVSFDQPTSTPVAIYFLFTNPGTPWKLQLDEPLPSRVELVLDKDSIVESD